MSVKPITSQPCNTQSCSETRCGSSGSYWYYKVSICNGQDSTYYYYSAEAYWSGGLIWSSTESNSGSISSVSSGGYTYTKGGSYNTSPSDDAICNHTTVQYCITRS